MTQLKERIATTTVPIEILHPQSVMYADAITVPAGTEGVFLRREWRTLPRPGLMVAWVNIVRVQTKFGTRFLVLLDDELKVRE